MSTPNTVTGLHQDRLSVNGVVGQPGIKEVILIFLEYSLQAGKYYLKDEWDAVSIPCVSIHLKPGDFLYFPRRWWH